MRFRFTINELSRPDHKDYLTDLQLLKKLVVERQTDTTNDNAPLALRLKNLYKRLEQECTSEDIQSRQQGDGKKTIF